MSPPETPTSGGHAPLPSAQDLRVALVTAPPGEASALARALVQEGLAACVNLVPGLRSVYRWQGEVCEDPETLLVVKTTADRLAALAGRVTQLHPYDVPELLALAPAEGLGPYAAWIRTQSASGAGEAPPAG